WWIGWGGVVALLLVLVLGGGEAYVAPYREVWDALVSLPGRLGEEALRAGPEGLVWAGLLRVPGWVAAQVPVSVAAGMVAAGGWLAWRSRYGAPWRADPAEVLPAERLRELVADVDVVDDRLPADTVDDLVLRLGVDAQTGKRFELRSVALRQHAVLAGATGYGKTVTLARILSELLVTDHARPLRVPILLLDMKADPELVEALEAMAGQAGRRFRLVTVTGRGERYNPIRRGSVEQVCSRIVECLDQVAGGGFSEPHHRESAEVFLRHAMLTLDDLVDQGLEEPDPVTGTPRPWRRDLPDLARLMSLRQLSARAAQLRPAAGRAVHGYLEYLQSDGKSLQHSIPGLAARVTNLVAGDAGRVLTETTDGVDVYDAIKCGDVVLFSLAAAADARAARQVGSLLLTDVGAVGDRLLTERWGAGGGLFLVGVDEFSALSGSTMTGLFARIRGAGGGLLLATQDLADLDAVSPQFRAAVLTNTNLLILHRQRSSAEQLAAHLGTRPGWEETLSLQDDTGPLGAATASTGSASLRPVDERLVHAQTLRGLPRGQAVIAVGHPTDSTSVVQIAPAPTTGGDPRPVPSQMPAARPVPLTKASSVSPGSPAAPVPPRPAKAPAPTVPGEDIWD
ncbi:type IV secretory system conjugative DNA transfer family protein, partial [Streptomyces bohaiensis]